MKIYTQDRRRVIEMPKDLWVTHCLKVSYIVSTNYVNPTLGEYKPERAIEVLREIFEFYRNGKNSYIMPLE